MTNDKGRMMESIAPCRRFLRVSLGVQDVVLDSRGIEAIVHLLRLFDRSRADQDGTTPLVVLADLFDDRLVLVARVEVEELDLVDDSEAGPAPPAGPSSFGCLFPAPRLLRCGRCRGGVDGCQKARIWLRGPYPALFASHRHGEGLVAIWLVERSREVSLARERTDERPLTESA